MNSSEQVKQKAERLSMREALQTKQRGRFLGLTMDEYIRYFFSGNALIAILVLVLIMSFLFKEGAGFMPMYQSSLELYRKAGLEYADIIRDQVALHRSFSQKFNALQNTVSAHYEQQGMGRDEARARTDNIDVLKKEFSSLIQPQQATAKALERKVVEVRDRVINNQNYLKSIELF
ncbi:MAG: hypothetical protein AAF571_12535, partial [Verrucomicrobiota bacterium]